MVFSFIHSQLWKVELYSSFCFTSIFLNTSHVKVHASKQATKLDKERIRPEMRVRDLEKEVSSKVGERVKLEDKVKELKNLIEELKVDIIEKETRLDHL